MAENELKGRQDRAACRLLLHFGIKSPDNNGVSCVLPPRHVPASLIGCKNMINANPNNANAVRIMNADR